MRRGMLWTIALLSGFGAKPCPASTSPTPVSGFGSPPKASPSAEAAQEPAIVDATSLGSPLVLDKGWRVGIRSRLPAANPGFDDSHWAVRDGKAPSRMWPNRTRTPTTRTTKTNLPGSGSI